MMKFGDRDQERKARRATLEADMTGPDRSAVIVGSAWVEEALGDAIRSVLEDHAMVNEVLDSGPLGTFSAKISIARLLGIISDDVYSDLNVIRRIRNKFAHSIANNENHGPLSFGDQDIRDRCLQLKCLELQPRMSAREAFLFVCSFLNFELDFYTSDKNRVSGDGRIRTFAEWTRIREADQSSKG